MKSFFSSELDFLRAQLDAKPVHSDDSDDEAPNGGDYTVYECPGLAPVSDFHTERRSAEKINGTFHRTTSHFL